MLKRIIDILGAVCGLLFIAPFTPFIALAIVINDGFPIIVRLDRVSEGQVVRLYKFRSMVRGARAIKAKLMNRNERSDGPFFKIADDPRLTRTGKWLRKFRLDEFPQFLNVLKGELSLVGPRPHEPEEVEHYPPEFKKLLLAQGGITGLSQVMGASALLFIEELEYDKYYIEHQSFWLDIKLLFKTVWIFFSDPTGV